MDIAYSFVFLCSLGSLFIFRKVAKRIGLVDKPNERKHHQGVIPLVGGISIFMTLCISFLMFLPINDNLTMFLGCGFVLVVIGALDDYYDISFKFRLVVQAAISLFMILQGGHSLHNLGYLMGNETLQLSPIVSGIITILGVIGAINAFNMVDGIDGLLGGLASVTFGALGFVFYTNGNHHLATFCFLFVTAMVPYILLNLGIPLGRRFKVFMGDAGSVLIGFSVVWLLIRGTQDQSIITFKPVTALWLIAIPLMDMATIMIRRMRKGQSPFKPDREHLHHICQRIGLSPTVSLLVICTSATIMAAIGIWSDLNGISESVMFISFLAVFTLYFLVISYIWRITTFIHHIFGQPARPLDNAKDCTADNINLEKTQTESDS
ncbi:UDP-N-acetylglucosamine--undecaprenyl-phosphate N-acetylglucosaminephosphotransferase [Photobacterium aphoticum]|uniref:Undecaprenyl-phosphate alpha-N-acetylglucosaminyl 1-phosphate transferase n=1 Tax=Photobacterium aphoticum TaxID=754436 RepID=A0A0J1GHA2_9GAMM|nr:UDP-N-acetylglucosamine--undecaprenyl-phosphate N-acetylglucosaminephosphotransferase [Photobacterium aphoticum]KLU98868.1 UDP-phosphate N-acetylglucosaminyl 1-phosphate transferase [Photobacterium aphoticum]PSU56692.1 undecaprenyl-phosphate alpha-N-acetylglucosaminyl 1-phosphate transferase [Photobacterium aphoticum]GHA38869.1 undecaprenyl-phosphate alpha-N-acetylglucosaminyl 1-phosphate transferase [Photobacterium aphoticum]